MSKIKILVVEPEKEPYEKEIENTLENLQTIVEGLIEITEIESNVDLVYNDEGKIFGLEFNRIIPNDIICGTFFIVGQKNGEHISLTKEQINTYKQYFRVERDKPFIRLLKELVRKKYKVDWEYIGMEQLINIVSKEN